MAGRTNQCAPRAGVIKQGLLTGLSAERINQDLVGGHASGGSTIMHLEITSQSGCVTPSWPTGLRRCHLQASVDLQHWADVTLPVVTVGTMDTVTVATGGNWFFRLELR